MRTCPCCHSPARSFWRVSRCCLGVARQARAQHHFLTSVLNARRRDRCASSRSVQRAACGERVRRGRGAMTCGDLSLATCGDLSRARRAGPTQGVVARPDQAAPGGPARVWRAGTMRPSRRAARGGRALRGCGAMTCGNFGTCAPCGADAGGRRAARPGRAGRPGACAHLRCVHGDTCARFSARALLGSVLSLHIRCGTVVAAT